MSSRPSGALPKALRASSPSEPFEIARRLSIAPRQYRTNTLKYTEDSRGSRSRDLRRGKRRTQTKRQSTSPQRADWQLASQVERVLELCLAGSRNPVLHSLDLHSVMHTNGKLYVRVVSATHGADQVLHQLEHATSWLRREVAEEITRKRVPELRFEVLADWPDDGATRLLSGEDADE